MIVFRSFAFAIAFYSWSTILSPIYVPLMLLPRRAFWFFCWMWVRSCLSLVRNIAGIRCEVRGRENIPKGAVIIASKHQSAWDTLIYNVHFEDCVYVLKRELFWFPFFGWFMWRIGMISVDRRAGGSALRSLVAQARERTSQGRSVIIFPQGTRTPIGAERPYLPGVAALYQQCDVPVVPVALNSGLYWARRRFCKQPGRIVLEYLPPIPPGLDRRTFMQTLRERIETASKRLEIEGSEHLRDGIGPT
jgi:1-acyl-sn-glycerol-3-phosphate acyltransferase